jgi:hypothetical protein
VAAETRVGLGPVGETGRRRSRHCAGRFSYALPTYAVAASFADQVAAATTFNFDPVSVVPDPNVYYWGTFVSRGGYGEAVDAGLKGPYQDELTVGVERLLGPNLTVGLKGTYRRLGVALEDRCDFDYVDTSEFRGCAFINPGSGETFAAGNYPACNGLDGTPTSAPTRAADPGRQAHLPRDRASGAATLSETRCGCRPATSTPRCGETTTVA